MAEPQTKTEFARRLGVTGAAISMWIERGKLTAPALLPDGRIDPDLAEDQLGLGVNPVASASARSRVSEGRSPVAAAAGAAGDATASRQLLRARALSASVQAERDRRQLNFERGRYLLADAAEIEWARTLGAFLLGIEQGFSDLADLAGLDRTQMAAVRRWWRDMRKLAATGLAEAAADASEFIEEDAA